MLEDLLSLALSERRHLAGSEGRLVSNATRMAVFPGFSAVAN